MNNHHNNSLGVWFFFMYISIILCLSILIFVISVTQLCVAVNIMVWYVSVHWLHSGVHTNKCISYYAVVLCITVPGLVCGCVVHMSWSQFGSSSLLCWFHVHSWLLLSITRCFWVHACSRAKPFNINLWLLIFWSTLNHLIMEISLKLCGLIFARNINDAHYALCNTVDLIFAV